MAAGCLRIYIARQEASPQTVVGFYTLSAASIHLSSLPDEAARKMPRYPSVPAICLGRLAVAASMKGQHIGSLLVLDALRRACRNELAWAVFLVDAKNERAATFYEKFLFRRFQENSLVLWMIRRQADKFVDYYQSIS